MIDFSLLAKVNEAIKKHAHERIEIFRQHNKSAIYFGGWKYIGGDAPISYDLFVNYERIDIRVDADELGELMPPEEVPLNCVRQSFQHNKYASDILIWLARMDEAKQKADIAAVNAKNRILELMYDVGEINDIRQAKSDIVNYKYDKEIGKRILGIDDDEDEGDEDDDEDDDDDEDEIRQRLRDIESTMWHDRNGYSQPVDDARCAEWFRLYMMLKRTENADRKIGKTDTKGSC